MSTTPSFSTDQIADLLKLAPGGLSQHEFNTFEINKNLGKARQFRAVLQDIIKLRHHKQMLERDIATYGELKDDSTISVFQLELDEVSSDLALHEAWIAKFSVEDIKSSLEKFEEGEQDYWINTIGTRAAIDILTEGKMSEETIRKMSLMKKEDFFKTVVIATKISRRVQSMTIEAEAAMEK